jgi:3-hydroxy-9,10-secoandrosta-1,3,5(10)-triene-9,17-dione monooxygenase reductase component
MMRPAEVLAPAPAGLDERRLRAALGRFATGVVFVTTEVGGTPLGLIVSTFTAVSLEPPLVSFCPARDSLTWRRMRTSGRFDVHVLAARHAGFARYAAERGADRFAGAGPALRDALAVLECEIDAEHAAGDHWIVVGRVRELHLPADHPPLVYWAGAFGDFDHHERSGRRRDQPSSAGLLGSGSAL